MNVHSILQQSPSCWRQGQPNGQETLLSANNGIILVIRIKTSIDTGSTYELRAECLIMRTHIITPPRNRRGVIFYFSLSLCLCVCVCLSVCEQNADQTATLILTRSTLNSCYCSRSNPIEIGDLRSKVKVTVKWYLFFFHDSLLTSLLWISVLLCPIKMKFGVIFLLQFVCLCVCVCVCLSVC